ncbi:Probable RNA-directed DNA polymerase from transposon X-element [Eumeta japonica]|uniref:Probable RNA-directed DNA polymerase from transposon X-element n=1 Tax=Eumeta variegata TaxID=151549 RepID=A0A4C1VZ12_EUMVA|nr:Probable RNA-directed DNA polymerase from transposon X-element [Eumeta japonica]
MKNELSRLYKEVRKSIKKDYKKHRQNTITYNLERYRSMKRGLKDFQTHKTWINKLENNLKERKSRKDAIELVTIFYKQLYKKHYTIENNTSDEKKPTTNIERIEEREVYDHIKLLKNDRSPGPDGISNDVFKLGQPILLSHLTNLFSLALQTGNIPNQWCISDIILLYKKGNPYDINKYKPISLLASAYKLFISILLKRLTPIIDNTQAIEQAGFRSGCSTIDHIHTLEQVIEKYNEFMCILQAKLNVEAVLNKV